MQRRALMIAMIASICAAACSDRTQALIHLDTNLALDREPMFVRVRASAVDGSEERSERFALVHDATFGVLPHGAIDQPLVLHAEAIDGADRLISTATRTLARFTEGKTIEVWMFLAGACLPACGEGETCGPCGCVADDIDVFARDCPIDQDGGVGDDAGPIPSCIENTSCGPTIYCGLFVSARRPLGASQFQCVSGTGMITPTCMNGICAPFTGADCVHTEGVVVTCDLACDRDMCIPGTPWHGAEYCFTHDDPTEACKGYNCQPGHPATIAALGCRDGACVEVSSPLACAGFDCDSNGCD